MKPEESKEYQYLVGEIYNVIKESPDRLVFEVSYYEKDNEVWTEIKEPTSTAPPVVIQTGPILLKDNS